MSTAPVNCEITKNNNVSKSVIENMRGWCNQQVYGHLTSDVDIANFLHRCRYEPENTKETIDAYYKIRSFATEIFGNRDPCLASVIKTFRIMSYAVLPKKTVSESRIIYCGLYESDPNLYIFSDVMKCLHMIVDMHIRDVGTEKGLVFIFDMRGITLGHVKKIDVVNIKNIMFYIQHAIPVRIDEIHFINMDSFSGAIMGLMKPFMRKGIQQKMKFHTEGNDSFYDMVPKDVLPIELGGEAGSLEIMRSELWEKVISNRDFFMTNDQKQIPKNCIFSDVPFKHDFFEEDFNNINID